MEEKIPSFYDTLTAAAIAADGLPGGETVSDLFSRVRDKLFGKQDQAGNIYAELIRRPKAIAKFMHTIQPWDWNKINSITLICDKNLEEAKKAAFDEAEFSVVDCATFEIKLANLNYVPPKNGSNWSKKVWATTDDDGLVTIFLYEAADGLNSLKISMATK